MPLTVAKIRSAEALARPYKMTDGQGLFLHVATTGTKTFRMAFRLRGREQLLTLGRVPELTLAEARARRDAARLRLRRGQDPRGDRRAGDGVDDDVVTFGQMADAWLLHQVERWSTVHAADVRQSLDLHVLPAIGALPLAAIDAPAVLRVLRRVEEGGSIETARRLRQRISGIFARAIAEGIVEIDPAARVTKALCRPAEPVHHAAALTIADARAVMATIDQVASAPAAKLASRFLALTAVRWAAVRGARWAEIEQLDGLAPIWRVPAVRMKLARAKKRDAGNDHLVPLSPAAVRVLRAAQNGCDTHSPEALIFAGRAGAALGENALAEFYAGAGLRGRHTPHGWRASFSTILNEALPADRAAIDLALAHAPKIVDAHGVERVDKVEGAYNRAQHLGRRRYLFERWGEWLVGDGEPPTALMPAAA